MFGILSYLFPDPPPVTLGTFLLYPHEEIRSDHVVVGFAKDQLELDTRVYLEYEIGEKKYFMIYKGSSRQFRSQEQPDFATTNEEFNALRHDAEQHCIYILSKTQAEQLFQRLEHIFWKEQHLNEYERSNAYTDAVNALESEPVLQSLNDLQISEGVARLMAQARYGRRPQQSSDDSDTSGQHLGFKRH